MASSSQSMQYNKRRGVIYRSFAERWTPIKRERASIFSWHMLSGEVDRAITYNSVKTAMRVPN
jgi:hypothetical protein